MQTTQLRQDMSPVSKTEIGKVRPDKCPRRGEANSPYHLYLDFEERGRKWGTRKLANDGARLTIPNGDVALTVKASVGERVKQARTCCRDLDQNECASKTVTFRKGSKGEITGNRRLYL